MLEIFFDILNYEKIFKGEKDNNYIMMNNSLKNSNILRILSLKYQQKQLNDIKTNIQISYGSLQIDY